MNIRQTVVSGTKWTGLASFFGVFFQLLQTMVLARLLTASDFGVMGIALVVIGFSQLFMDMGFSSIVIQKKDISQVQLNTIFWLYIMLGGLLFLALYLCAPVAAGFYNEPELTTVIRIVGTGFLIIPIESLFISLIQKNLEFKRIAQREIISRILSFAAGLAAACFGWGIYSLVVLHMTGLLFSSVFVVRMGLKYFKPNRLFSIDSLKGMFSFGAYIMGDNIVNFFNKQIDVLLIGRFMGIHTVGIYNQGKNFSMRPYMVINPVITQVSFPLLAKLKDDTGALRKLYQNTITYLCYVNFPIYVFMALYAEEVVLVLFGSQWLEAVPVVQVLALSIMVRSVFNPMGSLLTAVGKPKVSFVWNLVLFCVTPVLLVAAVPAGLVTVCLAQLCLMLVLVYPYITWILKPVLQISIRSFLAPLLLPLCYSACACVSYGLVGALPSTNSFIKLLLAGCGYFGIYLLLVVGFSKDISKVFLSTLKPKAI